MRKAGQKRNVTVIGGTGFVGRRLVRLLIQKYPDMQLRLLVHVRQGVFQNDAMNRIKVIAGDLANEDTLQGLIPAGGTVVNLAYLSGGGLSGNLQAAQNLMRACREQGAGRLVHLSSVSVYGKVPFDELDEGSPCEPHDPYELIKRKIEETLLAATWNDFELVILRPSAIFGPHGKNLLKMADDLTDGNRVMNYLKTCLFYYRRFNLVALENVVAAIIYLIDSRICSPAEIFIVSDDHQPENNYRYVEKKLMELMGIRDYALPVLPLPPGVAAFVLKLVGSRAANPRRRYHNSKLGGLGYRSAVNIDEGLASFAAWYKQKRQATRRKRPGRNPIHL